jgi:hypothetical protein
MNSRKRGVQGEKRGPLFTSTPAFLARTRTKKFCQKRNIMNYFELFNKVSLELNYRQ